MNKSIPSVAERIALALKRHEVEYIFAQSLPSAVILAAERIGIHQVAYRQENMGGVMADGYARISGRVGVVAAQNGPAAALLVAPLAEALKASVPIVALVQEVERNQSDRNAFQELDHLALFSACAKWTRKVITSDRIEDYVDAAFNAASSGRPGPAVLLLPADLLREAAPAATRPRIESMGRWPSDHIRPSDDRLQEAATLLATARHPVVMAGGGVMSGDGPAALARLVETACLPVFTTNMGKGALNEHHALACGVLGALTGPGSLGRHTRAIHGDADLVLQVGTRNNQNGTDSWRLLPRNSRVIQIDIDPQEIGRNHEALRLVGDATTTLHALNAALAKCDLSRRQAARHDLEQRIRAAWTKFEEDRAELLRDRPGPLRPERVMAELQKVLTSDSIVVADASYSSMWVVGQLRSFDGGMRFLTPRGLAGLGWGLPMAMGARVAKPGAAVFTIVGDGGFAHSWAELETMVRMSIPVVVVVLNNGVLGFQKDAETVKFGSFTTACYFAPVDHAAIARACGVHSLRVATADEMSSALQEAISLKAPVLIEVMTDPEAHPPISLFDGTLDVAREANRT